MLVLLTNVVSSAIYFLQSEYQWYIVLYCASLLFPGYPVDGLLPGLPEQ